MATAYRAQFLRLRWPKRYGDHDVTSNLCSIGDDFFKLSDRPMLVDDECFATVEFLSI